MQGRHESRCPLALHSLDSFWACRKGSGDGQSVFGMGDRVSSMAHL